MIEGIEAAIGLLDEIIQETRTVVFGLQNAGDRRTACQAVRDRRYGFVVQHRSGCNRAPGGWVCLSTFRVLSL